MLNADELVGLLAEPDRRRVVAALILSSGDLSEIAAATGLGLRPVVQALDRLAGAGLVEVGSDGVYVLLEEMFKVAARSRRQAEVDPAGKGARATPAQAVLKRAIVDGRLPRLPRKRSDRLVVLDHLAQCFEPGVRYPERQVNSILRAFDDDVAALRRYLVDEYFLDRADGFYWRSGGSVAGRD